MFKFEEKTALITLDKEIRVAGLSLQKSGLPISFESLGTMWELFGSEYRGMKKIENVRAPYMEYGVAVNTVPDYITGCGVTEIGGLDNKSLSYVIPAGKYIKDSFNAESFEKLVNDALIKRNTAVWAEKNNISLDGAFAVEVYPWEKFAKGNFAMYTLTPVKD